MDGMKLEELQASYVNFPFGHHIFNYTASFLVFYIATLTTP